MAIVFHHNDLDGHCAGAIVGKWIQENFPNVEPKYVEVDWGDDIDLSVVRKDEEVYIVDFYFSLELMQQLVKITSFIYVFDHHKSATEVTSQYPKEVDCHCDPESNFSGCELVWKHLYPDKQMPAAVTLIGDRDAWKWVYGKQTASFNEGMRMYPHQPQDSIWVDLLDGDTMVASNIQVAGDICLKYRDKICEEYRDLWGYEAELFGYKCYVLNLVLPGASSEMFGEKLQEYDICVGTVFKNGTWKLSFKSDDEIDVSKIAKKFPGGGGHKNAAGAEGLKELPFKMIQGKK